MAIVGEPLTPAVLETMGELKGWPPPVEPFDTGGKWVQIYRVWACHGYTDRGNDDRGVLRLERAPGATKEVFSLNVVQRVVHTGDLVHELRAQVTCKNDELASARQWTVSSRFLEPDGTERKQLAAQRGCAFKDGRVACAIEGNVEQKNVSRRVTSDWCLFEAVQRLPFAGRESQQFDVLEGLTVRRPGQRIAYAGEETFTRNGASLRLHRFHQLGRGMLPYEYWLDDNHRLLLVVSHDKAFILDPEAGSKVRWRSKTAARKGK